MSYVGDCEVCHQGLFIHPPSGKGVPGETNIAVQGLCKDCDGGGRIWAAREAQAQRMRERSVVEAERASKEAEIEPVPGDDTFTDSKGDQAQVVVEEPEEEES